MYRVIEMYGDFEPWWFIEGWEEDVIMSQSFDKYYDALKYYKSCWFELEKKNPLYKSRSDLMTIFWDPADQRWCDECDEYLQQYHSLALLQDEQVIPDEKLRPGYEKQTGQEKHRSCRMKWHRKLLLLRKKRRPRISILSPRKSPTSFTCGLETNGV